MKKVEIVHEELGRARVVESALQVWLERGWSRVTGQEDSQPAAATSLTLSDSAEQAPSDVTASRDLSQTTNEAQE